jgi:hypothetical protein
MRSAGSRRSYLTLASALRRGEQQAVQASASAASIRASVKLVDFGCQLTSGGGDECFGLREGGN